MTEHYLLEKFTIKPPIHTCAHIYAKNTQNGDNVCDKISTLVNL